MQHLVKAVALGVGFALAPFVAQAQTIEEDRAYSISTPLSYWSQSGPVTKRYGTLYESYTDRNGTNQTKGYSVVPNGGVNFTSKAPGRYRYNTLVTCNEYMNDPSTKQCTTHKTSWAVDVPVTHSMAVRRHTVAPQLSNAQADAILLAASNVLRNVDGSGDVQCPANMRRNGDVTTFTAGDGSIDSSAEFTALAAGVNLVWRINFCGGVLSTGIVGCGDTPGNRIAVENMTTDLVDGILWAHEFGHNQGLNHRDVANAVMNPNIDTSRLFVNNTECVAFFRY